MARITYVIVPIFNSESYLVRCLDSIFNQTYKNIFLIAVNDGSTDSSLSILEEYKRNHNNMLIVNKPNGGLSSARNAGLKVIDDWDNCYVTFVDSDDYIDCSYIEKMSEYLENNNLNIVCSNYLGFNNFGMQHPMYINRKNDVFDSTTGIIQLFRGELLSQAQAKLYRGSLWKDTYFNENMSFMEDQEIMYKIFNKTSRIGYLEYQGYYYFYSDNSLCRSKFTNKKVLDALDAYYSSITFKYGTIDDKEITNAAKSCFASAFLMLAPRYNSILASAEEKKKYRFYRDYVRKNKIVRKAVFTREKDVKKQSLYNFSPFIYLLSYKIYIFVKEKDSGR